MPRVILVLYSTVPCITLFVVVFIEGIRCGETLCAVDVLSTNFCSTDETVVVSVWSRRKAITCVWCGSDRPGTSERPSELNCPRPPTKGPIVLYGQTSSMLLPIPLANLALSFLNKLFPTHVAQHPHIRPPPSNALNFHLRHFHVATSSAHVYLSDVPHDLSPASSLESAPLSIFTSPLRISRPSSHDHFQAARHVSKRGQSAMLDWQEDEVPGPDVTRRETLLLLAKMTSNTYFEHGSRGWYNLTDEWNVVRHLLWRPARVPEPSIFGGGG